MTGRHRENIQDIIFLLLILIARASSSVSTTTAKAETVPNAVLFFRHGIILVIQQVLAYFVRLLRHFNPNDFGLKAVDDYKYGGRSLCFGVRVFVAHYFIDIFRLAVSQLQYPHAGRCFELKIAQISHHYGVIHDRVGQSAQIEL